MERALRNGRRKLEREKEREGFRTASNNGEERSYSSRKNGGRRLDPFSKPCPLQFPTFSFPRDTGTGMKSSVRDWKGRKQRRIQARSHRAEKANLEELNFSRIDLKNAPVLDRANQRGSESRLRRVFVARASLSLSFSVLRGRRNTRTEGKRRIFTLRFSHLIRLKVARKRDGTFVTGSTIGRLVALSLVSLFPSSFLSFFLDSFSRLFFEDRRLLPRFIASHNCGIVPFLS